MKVQIFAEALDFFLSLNMVYGYYMESLPLCVYLDFLSEKLTFSLELNLKAKLRRVQALAMSGYINEALRCFSDTCKLKRIPDKLVYCNELKKVQRGFYSFEEITPYLNHVTPFDEYNKAPIQYLKSLSFEQIDPLLEQNSLTLKYFHRITYLTLLFCIYRNENIEKVEFLEARNKELGEVFTRVTELLQNLRLVDLGASLSLVSHSLKDLNQEQIRGYIIGVFSTCNVKMNWDSL